MNTPAIDQLAVEGCRLDNCFAVSPICSPSRGATMTGLYPQRNGLIGLTHHGYRLNADVRHMASILSERGYRSILFGFQHECAGDPRQLGFSDILAPQMDDEQPTYPYMCRTAPEIAQAFSDFLARRENKEIPFFAQIGFNETHTPFHFGGVRPDRTRGVEIPAHILPNQVALEHYSHYHGAVRQADAGVGAICHALRANGIDGDTLIVFTVDHGIEAARDKWTCYDAGIGIACIMRFPGRIPHGSTCSRLTTNVSILPTILELAGLSMPRHLDGNSFASALGSPPVPSDEDRIIYGIYHDGGSRWLRSQNFKLIRHFTHGKLHRVPVDLRFPQPTEPRPWSEFYDLHRDPHEFVSRAADSAFCELVAMHDRLLYDWLKAVDDPILRGPMPTAEHAMAIASLQKSFL